jgi:5-formyltetrahydrofolate cyclo-ligase
MKSVIEDNTAWRRACRREMVARRESVASVQHAQWSAEIVKILRSTLEIPQVCAFCWPIKHEPDVRAIIEYWVGLGARAVLPVVVADDAPLRFRAWTAQSRLQPDRYGIPTPVDGEWLTPDLILLPLNGFDAAGYRLGYGGGYFDRTLAALSPRPLAVGVGFEINRLASIRPEVHDQRLDWIVSETGAVKTVG